MIRPDAGKVQTLDFYGLYDMNTNGNYIILEDAKSFSPSVTGVVYTDVAGAKFHVPMKLLVRLYEGARHDATQRGVNWEQFCNDLFSD